MKKNTIRKIALGLTAVVIFTLPACSKKLSTVQTETTKQDEAISEIDAFVISISAIKTSYNSNKITKLEIEDSVTQAMVIEGFMDELPNLYGDVEYKTKITEIYNTIHNIDTTKSGLAIEEGADSSFDNLKQIVNRIYSKLT